MLFVLSMIIVGTVCVVLWRRVATISRGQIIAAGVLFITGIVMAAPPGTHVFDYIGMTVAVVALTFLIEGLKRRGLNVMRSL